MKATIERATLLKGLSHVQSVVERRNTIPILSNVLIEATAEGSLKLMATDLDLQINESVPAAVDTPGATTVSAHTLFDIARKLRARLSAQRAGDLGHLVAQLPVRVADDLVGDRAVVDEGDLVGPDLVRVSGRRTHQPRM